MKKDIERIYDEDGEELSRKTTEVFLKRIRRLLTEKSQVVISLPGGRSVQPFYRKIPEFAGILKREEWRRLHFFWTDERLVPPDSSDSNYRLARELFLDDLTEEGLIEPVNVHRFPGETDDPEKDLKEYSRELNRISDGRIHIPVLGVGSDGHVGSLFPERSQLNADESKFLLVKDSPKPPEKRITISPEVIKDSRYPFLFFMGDEKREAYRCLLNQGKTYMNCPCKLALAENTETTYVITDLKK